MVEAADPATDLDRRFNILSAKVRYERHDRDYGYGYGHGPRR